MALKLSPLTFYKKIPKWVSLTSLNSSISFSNHTQTAPELTTDQSPLKSNDFEAKILYLRNRLVPDNLIQVLDTTTDLNSAVKIFKWASLQNRFRHTADTYFRIALKLGLAGDVIEMEGFCVEMVKEKCPCGEKACLELIDTFVEHHRLTEATRVLSVMILGGYKLSISTINVLMGALVEEKKEFKDVLFVYKEMVKADILPNVDTLNTLLEALFDAHQVDSALNQYKRMKKKGCDPNCRTFEVLIIGLIQKNRVDESVNILDEMFDIGCEVNLRFYDIVIPLFCSENRFEQGIRLFNKMRAFKLIPGSSLYSVMIQCLCENRLLDDAVNLLNYMIEIDLKPGEEIYLSITNEFCRIGKLEQVLVFLEDSTVLESSPYNALLEQYCSAGKFLQALDLFRKMIEKNVASEFSWNLLIRWLCENARLKEAATLLGKMIVSLFIPDCNTYSALVLGNYKTRKYEDALKLFQYIRSNCWVMDVECYDELVESLCRADKIEEAIEVFSYMSSNACTLQSSPLFMLINGVCANEKVDKAIRLRSLAYCSGTSCNSAIFTTIMLGILKLNKANNLLPVLSQMLVEGCSLDVDSYCILVKSMSAHNQTKECTMFFKLMVQDSLLPDTETLSILLSCLAKDSKLHTILEEIDKIMWDDCDILDSSMYNLMINGLLKEGYKTQANRFLDLMLEKGWVPDAVTHGLFIGSVRDEAEIGKIFLDQDSMVEDNVDNILAESLGKMQ